MFARKNNQSTRTLWDETHYVLLEQGYVNPILFRFILLHFTGYIISEFEWTFMWNPDRNLKLYSLYWDRKKITSICDFH
jgi:hypothetical protein